MAIAKLAHPGAHGSAQAHTPEKLPARGQAIDHTRSAAAMPSPSISAKEQPQTLLMNSVVNKLNDLIAQTMGDGAIQNAYENGLDVSPEATAERIVSFATGLYAAFQTLHTGEEETVLDSFMATIGEGIEQGFKEAREILEGLDVLAGDIASNVDKTYSLVQQGLAKFRAQFESPPA